MRAFVLLAGAAVVSGRARGAAGFGFGLGFHGKGNPVAREIDFHDGDLHALADFHDLAGIADEVIRKVADVDEAILMHADIHEGPEGGDVGDDAGQFHPDGEVGRFLDALGEIEGLEGFAGVAAGLGKLVDNVAQGGQAGLGAHVSLEVDFFPQGLLAQ